MSRGDESSKVGFEAGGGKKKSNKGKRDTPVQEKHSLVKWVKDLSFPSVAGNANILHDEMYKIHQLMVLELVKDYASGDDLIDFIDLLELYRYLSDELVAVTYNLLSIKRELAEVSDLKAHREKFFYQYGFLMKYCDLVKNDLSIMQRNAFRGSPEFEGLISSPSFFGNELDLCDEERIVRLEEEVFALTDEEKRRATAQEIKEGIEKGVGVCKLLSLGTADSKKGAGEFELSALKSGGVVQSGGSAVVNSRMEVAGSVIEASSHDRSIPSYVKRKNQQDGLDCVYPESYEYMTQNMALASISFIVKFSEGHCQRVSFPIKVPGNNVVSLPYFTTLPKFEGKDLTMEDLMKDVYELGASMIKKDPSKKERLSVSATYDSEQFLFAALAHDDRIADGLVQNLLQFLQGCDPDFFADSCPELLNMSIDLHSSRYMCDNCVISAVGMQQGTHDDDSFLSKIVRGIRKGVSEEVFKVDRNCGLFVHASAETRHGEVIITQCSEDVLSKGPKEYILEMDIGTNIGSHMSKLRRRELRDSIGGYTVFVSGMKDRKIYSDAYDRVISGEIEPSTHRVEEVMEKYQDVRLRRIAGVVVHAAIKNAMDKIAVQDVVEGVVDQVVAKEVGEAERAKRPSSSPEVGGGLNGVTFNEDGSPDISSWL